MAIQPPKPLLQGNGYFVLVGEDRKDFKGKHAYKDAKKYYNQQVYLHSSPPPPPKPDVETLLHELRGMLGDMQNYPHKSDWVESWATEAIAKIDMYLEP